MAEDKIFLEGMTFSGFHGTLDSERDLGQPFIVDVELRLDLSEAGASDDLAKTVDYSAIHDRAKEIVEGEPVNLTETLAERIARATLEGHPIIEAVKVKVGKPHVRLGGTVLGGSAVEVVRER